MRAIIIAAGRGERMRPFTDRAPKCLLPFAGRPLLHWQIEALAASGIEDIGIVKGYLGEKIPDRRLASWTNPKWASTNMVHSLLCAREALCSGERIVVAYGDIIYEPRVLGTLLSTAGRIVVAVDLNWRRLWQERMDDPLADAESLRMNERGEITDIGRTVSGLDEIEAQYMGLLCFAPEGADAFAAFVDSAAPGAPWLGGRNPVHCYLTDVLRGMIEAGHVITAAPTAGGWLEFDTVGDLRTYERLLRTRAIAPFFTPWQPADR